MLNTYMKYAIWTAKIIINNEREKLWIIRKNIIGIIITLLGGIFWGLSGACGQYLFEYKNVIANWLVPLRLLNRWKHHASIFHY